MSEPTQQPGIRLARIEELIGDPFRVSKPFNCWATRHRSLGCIWKHLYRWRQTINDTLCSPSPHSGCAASASLPILLTPSPSNLPFEGEGASPDHQLPWGAVVAT